MPRRRRYGRGFCKASGARARAHSMTPSKGTQPLNHEDLPPPRFLVVDPKVPASIRQLLDEAEGCANMGFLNGGGACARRAIETILLNEHAWLDDDYAAS